MAVNYITLRGSQFRWLPVIQVPTGTGNETPSHVAACGVRSLIRTKRLLCERGLRRLGPELRIAVEALDLRTEVASPFPGFGLCDQLGGDCADAGADAGPPPPPLRTSPGGCASSPETSGLTGMAALTGLALALGVSVAARRRRTKQSGD